MSSGLKWSQISRPASVRSEICLSIPEKLAYRAMKELQSRKGFSAWLDNIDDVTRDEMFDDLVSAMRGEFQ